MILLHVQVIHLYFYNPSHSISSECAMCVSVRVVVKYIYSKYVVRFHTSIANRSYSELSLVQLHSCFVKCMQCIRILIGTLCSFGCWASNMKARSLNSRTANGMTKKCTSECVVWEQIQQVGKMYSNLQLVGSFLVKSDWNTMYWSIARLLQVNH